MVAVTRKLCPWIGSGLPRRMIEWAAQNSWVTWMWNDGAVGMGDGRGGEGEKNSTQRSRRSRRGAEGERERGGKKEGS